MDNEKLLQAPLSIRVLSRPVALHSILLPRLQNFLPASDQYVQKHQALFPTHRHKVSHAPAIRNWKKITSLSFDTPPSMHQGYSVGVDLHQVPVDVCNAWQTATSIAKEQDWDGTLDERENGD